MNETNASAVPSANGKPPAPAAVIRRLDAAEESAQERLIKKHVPAWVVSGAVHVTVIALMILFLPSRVAPGKPIEKVLATTADKTDEADDENLTNTDPGIDPNIESALPEITRIDNQTVDAAVSNDNVGQPNAAENDTTALAVPGLNPSDFSAPGVSGDTGNFMAGDGGNRGDSLHTFPGRSGATKSRLIREGGGNDASERAVAMGLAWLASQQKSDGSWEYDVGNKGLKDRKAAATGMALLPFLAAGETHKPSKDKEMKYQKTVAAGLNYLMKMCPLAGADIGHIKIGAESNMYDHAIATIPLCEAFGMTKDPVLKPYAQAAINFIQSNQGKNGSWGYAPSTEGDTSIVGWQIQALAAAKLSKDLVVDNRVIKKAIKFLDLAASGSRKSMYGYADSAGAKPGTALTAVGLLCRYYIDGWGPNQPGMVDGVAGLMKNPPTSGPLRDMYYYYYATQVAHFSEGEDWKTWNEGKLENGVRKGGMRDWLVGTQRKTGNNMGFWDPEAGSIGQSCGRIGTTATCLLTLEVYYRHLPLYKRGSDSGAVKILEDN